LITYSDNSLNGTILNTAGGVFQNIDHKIFLQFTSKTVIALNADEMLLFCPIIKDLITE
jgi:hypothetical protein